ncbi:hypothetical protein ANN_17268 [Periplaneta americana]|uniref:Uncharacterized protein n=1 Tax=Periplaneta americana TaxID=6978 RepID=A0ABQ8STE3_PERAM|nr:hypothetical protein ANN_17268 [Periplaneta americana]
MAELFKGGNEPPGSLKVICVVGNYNQKRQSETLDRSLSTLFTAWCYHSDSTTAPSSYWRPDPPPVCDVVLQPPQTDGICSQFMCLNLLHP